MNSVNVVVSLDDTRYEHNRVLQPGNDSDMFSMVFKGVEWNTSAPWRETSTMWRLHESIK